jgi:hypothetical protein
MKEHSKDIWQGGKSNKLDFTITLSRGMHTLELYGSEGCCDGKTAWKFQVNGGKWLDFSTKNLNAMCQREPKVEYKGCALRFDGKNDLIAVKQQKQSMDQMTMETWVFADSMKGWRVIRNDKGWSKGDTHFQFKDNKLEFSIRGNSPQDQWFAFKFEEFTWYHVAVVYSRTGKYVKLYVNGKFEEQRTYKKTI